MNVEVKQKTRMSRIIIIVLLSIMLLMMAVTLYIVTQDHTASAEGIEIGAIFGKHSGENTVPLEEFIVNLKQEGKTKNFIKISLALMYTDQSNGTIIESNLDKIRDIIISTLRSKTYSDVIDDNKSLKEAIVKNINDALEGTVVEGVYVTDVIVQ